MSQNSLVLPTTGTVSGLQMTQYANNATDTLNTLASGTAAPASPEAGQFWHDTTNNLLKLRSLDNTTWIPFLQLNEALYSGLPYFPGQITGDMNRIINGGMLIDQINEGSSYSIPVNNTPTYTADQWVVSCLSSGSASGVTAQRVSDAPAGFTNSLKVTVGTGAGSVGATDFLYAYQPIEANNLSDFNYGTTSAIAASLSFWVKSSIAGTFAAVLQNAAGNRALVNKFTIATAGVWQQVTLPAIPGDQAGTWATGASAMLNLFITAAVGTTNQTATLGSWVGSDNLGSTSQTNSVLTTSGATFQITGVMLNPGIFCLPYQKRTIQDELQLCERYLFKTFPQGTAVAQGVGLGGAMIAVQGYGASAGNQGSGDLRFRVAMRATPTVTTYNPSSANAQFRNETRGTDCSSVTSNIQSPNNWTFLFTTAAGSSAGDTNAVQVTASARM